MARSVQTMKPQTAADKLEVLLAATPDSFRDHDISRDELAQLQAEPPAWLATLRREGPHPRSIVAQRLGVSNSGLARGGITEPLTTAQIAELLAEAPEWLVTEQDTQKAVRAEAAQVKREKSGQA